MYLRLKPCPRCCGQYLDINREAKPATVRCSDCGFVYEEKRDKIVEGWNQLDRPGKG